MSKKFLAFLILLIGLSTIFIITQRPLERAKIASEILDQDPLLEKRDEITLYFVGDIMLDRRVGEVMERKSDYTFPFLKIKKELNKADILFGNLESMISKEGYRQGSIYSFRADPRSIEGLTLAGFDLLSLSNNHSFDYGVNALMDTKRRLEEVDIVPLGAGLKEEAYSPYLMEKKGTTFAFLAYTLLGAPGWEAKESVPGISWYREDLMKEGIEEAKEKGADLIIISFHYGEEYQKEPSSSQKEVSKIAIDAGADIIIGHHPHVIQPVAYYKEGLIAYSLGNFVFDQDFSKETMEGLLLKIKVREKEIKEVEEKIIKINHLFQPEI